MRRRDFITLVGGDRKSAESRLPDHAAWTRRRGDRMTVEKIMTTQVLQRGKVLLSATVGLLLLPLATALGATPVDRQDCAGNANPDQRMAACTRVVDDMTETAVNRAAAFIGRASVYFNRKDYDHAIPDYSEAIQLDPKNARAFNSRGNSYLAKHDPDRAIADFSEAINLDPKFVAPRYNRGLAYRGKKDYERAIAEYDEAIKLDGKYLLAYKERGSAWYERKDYDRAIADYNEAITLNAKDT